MRYLDEKTKTMTKWIKRLFSRRRKDEAQQQEMQTPQPLRIEGVTQAPLTPEPDDAELAAQALLEMMTNHATAPKDENKAKSDEKPKALTVEYYQRVADQMAERERQARDQATLRTMRFLAWCEQELKKRDLPMEGKGSLQQMEVELYKRIDTVERMGGELKTRWQHCLAEVLVRQLSPENEE